MKKVHIIEHKNIKMLAFDDEVFDWAIEDEEMERAKAFCYSHPGLSENIMGAIQKHFLYCLGNFLGREITLAELNKAIQEGKLDD